MRHMDTFCLLLFTSEVYMYGLIIDIYISNCDTLRRGHSKLAHIFTKRTEENKLQEVYSMVEVFEQMEKIQRQILE